MFFQVIEVKTDFSGLSKMRKAAIGLAHDLLHFILTHTAFNRSPKLCFVLEKLINSTLHMAGDNNTFALSGLTPPTLSTLKPPIPHGSPIFYRKMIIGFLMLTTKN